MTYPLILTGACVLWNVFYIWSEYHWPPRKFFWAKAVSSLLFVAVGVTAYLFAGTDFLYAKFIIAALIMGLIGDLFLVFSATVKYFIIGLLAFLAGQIIYGAVFLKYGGLSIFDLSIYVCLVVLCVAVYKNSTLELGKMKIPVIFYVLIIAFMFAMAVSLIYKEAFKALPTAFISIGAMLFLASDGVLAFVRFKKDAHPALRGINLALYYAGQLMLALSIAFV